MIPAVGNSGNFIVLGGENLLQQPNVSTSYIVPLSENVILPGTVICYSLKT